MLHNNSIGNIFRNFLMWQNHSSINVDLIVDADVFAKHGYTLKSHLNHGQSIYYPGFELLFQRTHRPTVERQPTIEVDTHELALMRASFITVLWIRRTPTQTPISSKSYY